MQDRHRHQRAVVARRHDAGRDVVGGIVPRRDLLALAQGPLPGRHVVVVDLGRRRHRRIGEAQPRGVVLVAFDDIERVGRLLEGDDVLAAVGEVADHDRGQRILALQPHEVSGIERHADDVDAGPVRDQLAPVAAVGRGQRRHGDAKVDGIALVGQDEELVARGRRRCSARRSRAPPPGAARRRRRRGRSASARRSPGCRWRRCRSGPTRFPRRRANQPLSGSA